MIDYWTICMMCLRLNVHIHSKMNNWTKLAEYTALPEVLSVNRDQDQRYNTSRRLKSLYCVNADLDISAYTLNLNVEL